MGELSDDEGLDPCAIARYLRSRTNRTANPTTSHAHEDQTTAYLIEEQSDEQTINEQTVEEAINERTLDQASDEQTVDQAINDQIVEQTIERPVNAVADELDEQRVAVTETTGSIASDDDSYISESSPKRPSPMKTFVNWWRERRNDLMRRRQIQETPEGSIEEPSTRGSYT